MVAGDFRGRVAGHERHSHQRDGGEWLASPITAAFASVFLITCVGFWDVYEIKRDIGASKVAKWGTVAFSALAFGMAGICVYLGNFHPAGIGRFSPRIAGFMVFMAALVLVWITEGWIAVEVVQADARRIGQEVSKSPTVPSPFSSS